MKYVNSTVVVVPPMQGLLDPVSQLLSTYHAMAHSGPILSSGGTVQIRFISLDLGTTKWREGTFEIVEKDNKASLCLRFNCGTLKFFQVLCFFSPDQFFYIPWFKCQLAILGATGEPTQYYTAGHNVFADRGILPQQSKVSFLVAAEPECKDIQPKFEPHTANLEGWQHHCPG